ncbi:hypothetical protein [uncultured Dysosmobacter sp.]|uniref:hypothetical protein n=1 Tax=uncultured Dysosmobacter sp. TaxID=2591384 RepID=UPI002637C8BF|nr:hypothetical protein [uncultured Dysosmobacter sp.]
MDQMSILISQEEQMYKSIKEDLIKTLYKNGLNESYLSLKPRKSYYSVMFNASSVVVRISVSPTPTLSVPTALLLPNYSSMVANKKSDYTKVKIWPSQNIKTYTIMLQDMLQGIIDRIPKEYDCCSRYLECSNARTCIHPDKEFALKCGYKKILRSGRIFFGENRNID